MVQRVTDTPGTDGYRLLVKTVTDTLGTDGYRHSWYSRIQTLFIQSVIDTLGTVEFNSPS